MTLAAKLLTELVGTFIFLAVIALSGPMGPLAPIAIGGALVAMVYMGGHVSGAHYNPAVSLGVFLRGKLGATELVTYWAVQVVGAVLAFGFGYLVSGQSAGLHPGRGVATLSAFAIEAVFTGALVVVVLNTAVTRATQGNSFYGLAIGITIVAAVFAGGPISGGSFNPAIGFAATLASAVYAGGSWSDLWLYLVAPLLGAAAGAGIHRVQMRGSEAALAPPEGHPSPGDPSPVPD